MNRKFASAHPRKHFFLEMFTRDLSLEDCILDLIDNSVDALVRTRNLNISQEVLLNGDALTEEQRSELPVIEVHYSDDEFRITDFCGGIPRAHALKEVFTFGHSPGVTGGQLGVYGIGLKRAIFKIGNMFRMESRTPDEGFVASLDVKKWSEEDDDLDDWRIPLELVGGSKSRKSAGTDIQIRTLRDEVKMRFNDGAFPTRLSTMIAQTYALFLQRYVRIVVNGEEIEGSPIPLSESSHVTPAHDEFNDGGVAVKLFASLAARGPNKEWSSENAGWYVACNGRIVVAANKDDLTGWATSDLPHYHAKYAGFVGLATFQCSNPALLPWTTTKRGLNRESSIYQQARTRMKVVARPIITFLNNMYRAEILEEPEERQVADEVKHVDVRSLATRPITGFQAKVPSKPKVKTTVRVQYDAEMEDITKIQRHTKRYGYRANRIGRMTFDYYMEKEGLK